MEKVWKVSVISDFRTIVSQKIFFSHRRKHLLCWSYRYKLCRNDQTFNTKRKIIDILCSLREINWFLRSVGRMGSKLNCFSTYQNRLIRVSKIDIFTSIQRPVMSETLTVHLAIISTLKYVGFLPENSELYSAFWFPSDHTGLEVPVPRIAPYSHKLCTSPFQGYQSSESKSPLVLSWLSYPMTMSIREQNLSTPISMGLHTTNRRTFLLVEPHASSWLTRSRQNKPEIECGEKFSACARQLRS